MRSILLHIPPGVRSAIGWAFVFGVYLPLALIGVGFLGALIYSGAWWVQTLPLRLFGLLGGG